MENMVLRFQTRENRNRYLNLIAMNMPSDSGYGFGLEFEGLETAINQSSARGRLIAHRGQKAIGAWEIEGDTVTLDFGFIATHTDGVERLRERLWEIACQFGAGN